MRPPSGVFCQTEAFSLQSGPLLAFSARGKREGRKLEKLGANRRGLRVNRGRREGVEGVVQR